MKNNIKCHFCGKELVRRGNTRIRRIKYENKLVYICPNCYRVEITCPICNKKFKITRTKLKDNKNHYCSLECSQKAATSLMSKQKQQENYKMQYCDKCKRKTNHNKNNICMSCIATNASNKEFKCEKCDSVFKKGHGYKGIKIYCDKCRKDIVNEIKK